MTGRQAARWLAIDPGDKRIGVAAGSMPEGLAGPVDVVDAKPFDKAVARIIQLAAEYGAQGIVVGWPLNMDDTEGPQALDARKLAQTIAWACDLDVRLWDERLSSFTADQALKGTLTRQKRRARQDALAAAAILQDFFARNGAATAERIAKPG